VQRVIHFEIYTDDPEAGQPFYRDVFGWKFKKFKGGPVEYWLVTTGDYKDAGINGGLLRPREDQVPARSIQLPSRRWRETWWKRLRAEDGDSEMGWLAYAQDPAGNVFGLMEPDTSVK